ncbi:hypothetical protein PI125_g19177 [Phytophthora idaei]|nr:hypothetical protein PI125_g19177 [Phytophthora idaei]
MLRNYQPPPMAQAHLQQVVVEDLTTSQPTKDTRETGEAKSSPPSASSPCGECPN